MFVEISSSRPLSLTPLLLPLLSGAVAAALVVARLLPIALASYTIHKNELERSPRQRNTLNREINWCRVVGIGYPVNGWASTYRWLHLLTKEYNARASSAVACTFSGLPMLTTFVLLSCESQACSSKLAVFFDKMVSVLIRDYCNAFREENSSFLPFFLFFRFFSLNPELPSFWSLARSMKLMLHIALLL